MINDRLKYWYTCVLCFWLYTAVPIIEQSHNPAKEKLVVPTFFGKKHENNQGIKISGALKIHLTTLDVMNYRIKYQYTCVYRIMFLLVYSCSYYGAVLQSSKGRVGRVQIAHIVRGKMREHLTKVLKLSGVLKVQ